MRYRTLSFLAEAKARGMTPINKASVEINERPDSQQLYIYLNRQLEKLYSKIVLST